MATLPQQMVPQQQPPGGPQAPSMPAPPAPPPPPTYIDPLTAPRGRGAYLIDPLILDRPVKFVVRAADRMVSREKLQQALPAIFQTYMSPNFMAELGKLGYVVDTAEVTRLVWDATGLGRSYRIIRPLNESEQAARQAPTPEMNADLQKAQLEADTRREAFQVKAQYETQIAQIEAAIDNKEIDEETARFVLKLFQDEQIATSSKPDPQAEAALEQTRLQAEMQKKQMELQGLRAKLGLDLQGQQQKNMMAHQAGQQKLGLDALRMRMQAATRQPNTGAELKRSENPT